VADASRGSPCRWRPAAGSLATGDHAALRQGSRSGMPCHTRLKRSRASQQRRKAAKGPCMEKNRRWHHPALPFLCASAALRESFFRHFQTSHGQPTPIHARLLAGRDRKLPLPAIIPSLFRLSVSPSQDRLLPRFQELANPPPARLPPPRFFFTLSANFSCAPGCWAVSCRRNQ